MLEALGLCPSLSGVGIFMLRLTGAIQPARALFLRLLRAFRPAMVLYLACGCLIAHWGTISLAHQSLYLMGDNLSFQPGICSLLAS